MKLTNTIRIAITTGSSQGSISAALLIKTTPPYQSLSAPHPIRDTCTKATHSRAEILHRTG